MKQLTKKEAIKFAESKEWENWSDESVAYFQLHQECLCMDWSRFHEAMEKALGRPVWTHEFAYPKQLKEELEGKIGKPTFQKILSKVPKDKTVIVIRR